MCFENQNRNRNNRVKLICECREVRSDRDDNQKHHDCNHRDDNHKHHDCNRRDDDRDCNCRDDSRCRRRRSIFCW